MIYKPSQLLFRSTYMVLTTLALIFFSACATTEFLPWEGTSIETGTGGTRKVVNGIDVWQYGSPQGRYQIIGLVQDTRDPDASFGDLFDDVTKKAAEAGADAVILVNSERYQTGITGAPTVTESKIKKNKVTTTSSPGTASIDYEEKSIFKAVKYLR
ncbi:MAG: hypothetical protein ACK5LK_02515 [Chthoniobacterales bacterium]